MYVSITGLKPKGWLALGFWRHAVPCKMEADKAEGCKFTMVKSVDGFNHTLTGWESKGHMVSHMQGSRGRWWQAGLHECRESRVPGSSPPLLIDLSARC